MRPHHDEATRHGEPPLALLIAVWAYRCVRWVERFLPRPPQRT